MNRHYDVETLIIGGGQAGLAVGYHLAKLSLPFLIVDANRRIGDAWRNRWDSLRLFSVARCDGLPGLAFPARGSTYPTKDQMADYLESYAERFSLPVRTGTKIDALSKQGDRFVAAAGPLRLEAAQVVVAMADYQVPRVPAFAEVLDPEIVQLHAGNYQNPSQLRNGAVLVVGAGNSGADIAIDIARSRAVWISGKEPGHVPVRIEGILWRFALSRVWHLIEHRLMTVDTRIGRKLRPKLLRRATPLLRVKPRDLTRAGIKRVPRVVGARDGRPLLADDRTLDAQNVIWCTGYGPGFTWIHLPVFGKDGRVRHERGVSVDVPGLYFVGLHFLYSMSSATIDGVGRDAEEVADAIELRAWLRGGADVRVPSSTEAA
jgi:putative flavoprotein involved in K+ transport